MNKIVLLTGVLLLSWLMSLSSQPPPEQELFNKANSPIPNKDKVDALNQLGIYYAPYDYSKALYYLQESRTLAMDLDYKKGLGDADYFSGRVYYYQDEYHISKKYLDKSSTIYQHIQDNNGLADYYFAIGELEMLFGNYVKAMDAYQSALQLEKETKDLRGQAIILNCIAGLHREQGNLGAAMEYSRRSLTLRYVINDSAGIATNFTSIASIFEIQQNLDSAVYYALKGLDIRLAMNEIRRVGSSKYLLGRLQVSKKQANNALKYLNDSYKIFSDLEDKTGMIIVRLEQGKAYELLDDLAKSKSMVDEAHEMALITQNNNLIKDTYKNISEYYLKNNDYRQGYEFFVKYKSLEDSIMNWRKSKQIEEMEMLFQNQQKDIEIENLKTTNQLQQKNNIILWLSLIVIIILSAFVFYLYRLKAQNLKHNQLLLEKEKIIYQKDHQMQENERYTLEQQLESKNRELGSKILSMLRTNEMQETLVNRLSNLAQFVGKDKKALKELNGIIRELENHSAENLWEEFDKTFQSIHSDFYKKLLERCPDLTPSEIKIAAFLKLNLSTKEIAALTFKTESGIKSTRHRLRKKLNINPEENLISILIQM